MGVGVAALLTGAAGGLALYRGMQAGASATGFFSEPPLLGFLALCIMVRVLRRLTQPTHQKTIASQPDFPDL